MVTYEKGKVILRQGEKADCMYFVHSGVIGIYKDYGTNHANKVAEIHEGEYLGEMELIEMTGRSATAVVLSDTAELEVLSDNDYLDMVSHNPVQVFLMMKTLTERLRKTTADYNSACQTVYETVMCVREDIEPSPELIENQKRFSGVYLTNIGRY